MRNHHQDAHGHLHPQAPLRAGEQRRLMLALVVALIGILLAGLIALAANVLPRGTTRGWRPGGP